MEHRNRRRQRRKLWPRAIFILLMIVAVVMLSFFNYHSGATKSKLRKRSSLYGKNKLSINLNGAAGTSEPVKKDIKAGKTSVSSTRSGRYHIKVAKGNLRIRTSAEGLMPFNHGVDIKKGKLASLNIDMGSDKSRVYFPAGASLSPIAPQVIRRGNPNQKKVALTIDDGWNADDRILNLLERYKIKATVFIIGGRGIGDARPDWIKRMDRDGFEIATHTYDHYILTNLSDDAIATDIRKGQAVLSRITGKKYPYMRPSGGAYDRRVLKKVAALGYKMVLWSNDLGDTRPGITVEREIRSVLSRLTNGDIILAHFGGYRTYEALAKLIPEIQRRGYKITTVTEIMEGMETTATSRPPLNN